MPASIFARPYRDLAQCQKRPSTVSKETYYSVQRDLLQVYACKHLCEAIHVEVWGCFGERAPCVCVCVCVCVRVV
jgi:hypothetical protein